MHIDTFFKSLVRFLVICKKILEAYEIPFNQPELGTLKLTRVKNF